MGSRFLRKEGLAAAAVLASILAAGCSTMNSSRTGPGAESAPGEDRSAAGPSFLPEPLGTVTLREHPLAFCLGWMGIVAGASAGLYYDWIPELGFVAAVGGGCLLTLAGRGLEDLWHLAFP